MPYIPMQHADGTVTMEWVEEPEAGRRSRESTGFEDFLGSLFGARETDFGSAVEEAERTRGERSAAAGRFFTERRLGGGAASRSPEAALPGQEPVVPQLPMEPAYAPTGAPATLPPIAEPSFAEFPEPEETQTNPGFSELVAYMREREGRTGALFDQVMQQMESEQPNIWSRLGGMISAAAARDSWAESGAAANEYLAGERAQRDSRRNQMLQLGLAREDLGGDVAEAVFNESTGRWEAGEATREGRYRTRVANVEGRNTAAERAADRRTTVGIAGWEAERERYEAEKQRLDRATLMAAQLGDPSAFSSIFGTLPEGMQRGVMERQATSGLASIIATNGNRAHREMERLAGRTLPRPPRTLREDPQALARWYASNGVPLGHPDVLRAFPGMGGGE